MVTINLWPWLFCNAKILFCHIHSQISPYFVGLDCPKVWRLHLHIICCYGLHSLGNIPLIDPFLNPGGTHSITFVWFLLFHRRPVWFSSFVSFHLQGKGCFIFLKARMKQVKEEVLLQQHGLSFVDLQPWLQYSLLTLRYPQQWHSFKSIIFKVLVT